MAKKCERCDKKKLEDSLSICECVLCYKISSVCDKCIKEMQKQIKNKLKLIKKVEEEQYAGTIDEKEWMSESD